MALCTFDGGTLLRRTHLGRFDGSPHSGRARDTRADRHDLPMHGAAKEKRRAKGRAIQHSRGGYGITVALAADGVSEKYWCRFTGDRHITEFAPSGGQMRWELPAVQSARERAVCLEAIKRLDHCDVTWAHYGKPIIGIDSPTKYRVTYKSIPEKNLVGNLSLFTNIYFLVTRKGTVCGIWAGE
jgi:hypothetical protein